MHQWLVFFDRFNDDEFNEYLGYYGYWYEPHVVGFEREDWAEWAAPRWDARNAASDACTVMQELLRKAKRSDSLKAEVDADVRYRCAKVRDLLDQIDDLLLVIY